ncbi:phosphoribosyltransferase [Nocardia camponoti]|uniref:Phosphoribosyltransferase n=1 Tax=Nocardia camponoti TaxID=1616106 RepID=A0A917QKK8_9NOCA|nr:phosphoribosyltransferase [Nocardia camponoti]GGK53799.1 hypothetical protein GCM10011591_27010 [Nocardia camponoti]
MSAPDKRASDEFDVDFHRELTECLLVPETVETPWATTYLGIALTHGQSMVPWRVHDTLPLELSLDQLVEPGLRRNPRRAHLLVSTVLGKHIPTDPRLVLGAGVRLAGMVEGALDSDDCVVLGFAETATSLGHIVAAELRARCYLHSTRRPHPEAVTVTGFEEGHSHATSHLLQPVPAQAFVNDLPLVLVDDEISTGDTAIDAIRALHAFAPRSHYVLASLVDLRTDAHRANFAALELELDAQITTVCLATGSVSLPDGLIDAVQALPDPALNPIGAVRGSVSRIELPWAAEVPEGGRHGVLDTDADGFALALADAFLALSGALDADYPARPVIVIGHEEFMYLPLMLASSLVSAGRAAYFQTTTRSPAYVLDEPGYPLRRGFRFTAPEPGAAEPRFLYNAQLADASPVLVLVVDAPADSAELTAPGGLVDVLTASGADVLVAVVGGVDPRALAERRAADAAWETLVAPSDAAIAAAVDAVESALADPALQGLLTSDDQTLAGDRAAGAQGGHLVEPQHEGVAVSGQADTDAVAAGQGRLADGVVAGMADAVTAADEVAPFAERVEASSAGGSLVRALGEPDSAAIAAAVESVEGAVAGLVFPPVLRGPEFGSYAADEVAWLLKDLSDVDLEADVAEREARIQAGVAHYAESLPIEYQPDAAYGELFTKVLADSAERLALAVATVSELVVAERGSDIVLVSLARAGTPVGVLMRRWLARQGNVVPHYAVSIVRDRGIDSVALDYLAAHHDTSTIVFVDGWTGKGAITHELREALEAYEERGGARFNPELVVLADPGNCVRTYGTRDDFLIASACLNSTVSGLVSRTVLNDQLIGPGEFHGAKFYRELADGDVSNELLDAVTAAFETVADQVADSVARMVAADRTPDWSGWASVEKVRAEYGVATVNFVKPGVGETTRVLLRRVPWRVLVREADAPEHAHIRLLAEARGVPVEVVPDLAYSCMGLIRELDQ